MTTFATDCQMGTEEGDHTEEGPHKGRPYGLSASMSRALETWMCSG